MMPEKYEENHRVEMGLSAECKESRKKFARLAQETFVEDWRYWQEFPNRHKKFGRVVRNV